MELVYKYYPESRTEYLTNELMRFSQPSVLNDPFECTPTLSNTQLAYLSDISAHIHPFPSDSKDIRNSTRSRFLSQVSNRLDRDLGILSLSRRWDSALMWAHYCSSHTGYCLGFNSSHPFFAAEGLPEFEGAPIQTVVYRNNRVSAFFRKIENPEILELLCTKGLDWAYEEEVRVLRHLSKAKTITDNPKTPNTPAYLFKVPHDALAEIIIGMKASSQLRDELITLGKTLGVPVYISKI